MIFMSDIKNVINTVGFNMTQMKTLNVNWYRISTIVSQKSGTCAMCPLVTTRGQIVRTNYCIKRSLPQVYNEGWKRRTPNKCRF